MKCKWRAATIIRCRLGEVSTVLLEQNPTKVNNSSINVDDSATEAPGPSNSWKDSLIEFLEFRSVNGKYAHPSKYSNDPREQRLAEWICYQQETYEKMKQNPTANTPRVIALLQQVNNFPFSKHQAMIDQLTLYKSENGNTLVPCRHGKLGDFVLKVRKDYRNKTIDENLKSALDSMDFEWDVNADAQWNSKYQQLKRFHTTHMHCDIGRAEVAKDTNLKPLKRWISTQRTAYKDKKLTVDKEALLEAIGFSWEATRGRKPAKDKKTPL